MFLKTSSWNFKKGESTKTVVKGSNHRLNSTVYGSNIITAIGGAIKKIADM